MQPLLRSHPQQIGAGLAFVSSAALGFLPLFGGPSYESALGAGLVLPALSAVATAIEVARARPEPLAALGRGAFSGLVLAAIALLVSLLHGLRAGFCDPGFGLVLFLLGPAPGAILGGAWGAFVGLVAPERRRWRIVVSVLGALAGPFTGIAVSVLRFYTSPMVFAFDPFFGHFAGPLYDTVFDPRQALASYRLGSALTLLAAAVAAFHVSRGADGRLRPVRRLYSGVLAIGACAALGSLAITLAGASLGHWATARSIERELGRKVDHERCEVIHPPEVLERDARLLARDCVAHLTLIERWLGVRGPEGVRVYLFASSDQKGRLTGAAQTQIAKPWRAEVYLQAAVYPHPVLGHELAHVVAGAAGRGPFRVAGPLGGLLPDPGRIEGVAVAAAPDEDEQLTAEQWAKAMLDLGILPSLESLFKLSFFGENASKAYTVAGAFVGFLHRTSGSEVVRRWYGGEELSELVGKSLPELDQDFRAALSRITLPPEASHTAKARFDRPAIFGRRCPHVVDRLELEANQSLAQSDPVGCRESFEHLLRLDPRHVRARLGLGSCALRAGDPAAARARWQAVLGDDSVPKLHRAAAEEALADLALALAEPARAAQGYQAVEQVAFDEDRLRTLEVKQHPPSELARRAIVALLIGEPPRAPSFEVAAERLGEWAVTDPEQGLADYLLGRNFYLRGSLPEAAFHLDRGLARKLDSARIKREALRVRLIVGCAEGNVDSARRAFALLQGDAGLSENRRRGVERLAERCGVGSATAAGHGTQ